MDGEQIFDYVMDSPENTNPSVLKSLINSSKELPAVSGTDNGKVLGVVGGAWKKMDAPSGGDPFIVTFSGEYGRTCDKTFAQIKSAFEAGRRIYATLSNVNVDFPEDTLLPLCSISPDFIGFYSIAEYGDNVYWCFSDINSNNLSYVWQGSIA